MAVSALSGDALLNAGVQNMSDVSRQAPVLEMQSSVSPIMTNFRIRRVGNLGNIPTFEPAVGLFVDGAFRSRAIFGATDLFDVERIEILRGPQSTLYGKNTTAGVIGIYTAPPSDVVQRARRSHPRDYRRRRRRRHIVTVQGRPVRTAGRYASAPASADPTPPTMRSWARR